METISNFATSTLSGTITAGATSLTVANGAVFPATGTFRIRIDNEILTVATRAGNVLSGLGRGIEGTSAVGHTTGVTVRHVLTAAAVHQLRQDHVWVSVKDPAFGAVGDGVTDDGPACRAALAAVASGGTVYFPPGTYLFASLDASTDCLNISQNDHIAIVGSGIGATTLKVGVASWRSIIRGDQSDNIAIRDMTLDGNKASFAGSPGQGLRFLSTAADQIRVSNIEIKNTDDRSASITAKRVWVDKCWIHNSDGGLGFNDSTDMQVWVTDNLIHDIGIEWTTIQDAIYFGGQYGVFRGNHIFGSTDTGINIGGATDPTGWVRATGNLIYKTGNSGINTGGGDNQIITDNIVFATGRKTASPRSNAAIRIRDDGSGTITSNGVIVRGNRCYEDTTNYPLQGGALGQLYGIEIINSAGGGLPNNLLVTQNDLRGNTTSAIKRANVTDALMGGNLGDLDLRPWANVRDYGALQDGTTDDAAAIQACLNNNSHVYFPPGPAYIIGTTLTVGDNHKLRGGGMGSELKAKNGLNADLIAATAGSANIYFVEISELRLNGNKANNTSGHCLNLRQAHTWTVERLHIKDAADRAVNIEGTASFFGINNWISHCRLENSTNATLKVGAFSPNNHIENCILGGSTNFAIMEIQNDECQILGNHVHTAGTHGIDVSGDNCIIAENYVESSKQHGIRLDAASLGCRVSANVCFNNGLTAAGDGITVYGTDATIMGNRCFDRQATKTQDYGIQLQTGSTRNLVIGNHARTAENQTGSINDLGSGNTLANNQTS